MSRTFTLGAVFGVIAAFAAGCGGEATPAPSAPPAPAPSAEPPPAPTPEPAPTAEKAPEPPKPPTQEQLVAWYQGCWGKFSAKAWDDFTKCYSADAVSDQVDTGMPTATGPAAIVEGSKQFVSAFPDVTGELQLTLVNGKNIVGVGLVRGTHTGPMKGPMGELPATGKKVGYLIGHVLETDDAGLAKREWLFSDSSTTMAQLGMNPMPARPVLEQGWAEKVTVIAKGDETETKNVAAYNKDVESFNKHDVKALSEGVAESLVWSEMAMPKDQNKKEMTAGLKEMFKGFTDLKLSPTSTWGAGDYVVVVGHMDGTNDGNVPSMKLKKTGKKVSLTFLEIDKYKDGKITNAWLFYDGGAFANQLGLIPPPGEKKSDKKHEEKKHEEKKSGGDKKHDSKGSKKK